MDSHPMIGAAAILSGERSGGIEGVGAKSEYRKWMYRRFIDGHLNREFQDGVDAFVEFASGQQAFKDGEKIRCPCRKCGNVSYQPPFTVTLHLGMYGFVPNYYTWRFQGEGSDASERNSGDERKVEEEELKANEHKLNEADVSGTSVALHKGESRWQKYAAYQDGVEFSPVWTYLTVLMEAEDEWACDQLAGFRETIRVRIETMSRPLPGSTEPQEVDAEQIFADVFEEIPEDTKLRVFERQEACNAGSVPSLTRDRGWMYRRFDEDGTANMDFWTGVEILSCLLLREGKIILSARVVDVIINVISVRVLLNNTLECSGSFRIITLGGFMAKDAERTRTARVMTKKSKRRTTRMETRSSCFLRSMQSSTSSGHILRPCASKMMRSGVAMRLIACVRRYVCVSRRGFGLFRARLSCRRSM